MTYYNKSTTIFLNALLVFKFFDGLLTAVEKAELKFLFASINLLIFLKVPSVTHRNPTARFIKWQCIQKAACYQG
jgi:hypothetical protein